jgi:RNA polymerase sigma-70 factor (ECF subfamily)
MSERRVPGPDLSERLTAHRPVIYRYILSIVRDPAAAEDLTQDTLLRAHSKLAKLEDTTKLVTWMYRIATNLCRDRFRRTAHQERTGSVDLEAGGDSGPEEMATPGGSELRLDKAMERKEMSDCVQEYLAGLPDPYRSVILLHDTEGLTNPEIATMLDVTLATVKIRLHRARENLRESLVEACVLSTDERGVTVCERKPRETKK